VIDTLYGSSDGGFGSGYGDGSGCSGGYGAGYGYGFGAGNGHGWLSFGPMRGDGASCGYDGRDQALNGGGAGTANFADDNKRKVLVAAGRRRL
jgi:hypothetical protein